MNSIINHVRNCEPELVVKKDRIAVADEFADYFFAFTMLNESLYSINGRYPTKQWTTNNTRAKHSDQVLLTHYELQGSEWVEGNVTDLGQGGDPRIATDADGKQVFAFIIGSHYTGTRLTVYDFNTGERTPIHMADPDMPVGKNWQPFIRDGELFAVYSLNPFRIVWIDLKQKHAELISEDGIDFNLHASYEPFTIFRGGASAIELDGNLYGVGRTTTSRVRHTPFFWDFSPEGQFGFTFTEVFQPLLDIGYKIIDPTSLFIHDGDLYLGLSCSERDWAHTQIVSDYLLRFPNSDKDEKVAPQKQFSTYLKSRHKCGDRYTADLGRHMFSSDDMPATAAHKDEYGGRSSIGQPGYLIYGPYIPFKEAGTYTVELSYFIENEDVETRSVVDAGHTYEIFEDKSLKSRILKFIRRSNSLEEDEVEKPVFGTFDVNIHSSKPKPRSKIVAETDITDQGTGMSTLRLEFEIEDPDDAMLETRVFANEGAIFTVFGVRIWRHELTAGGDPDYPWADFLWPSENTTK